MEKESNRSRTEIFVRAVMGIIGIALALYLCQAPQFRRQEVHKCATTNENWQTGPLTQTEKAVQEFVPQKSELMEIAVWIDRQNDLAREGKIRLSIYSGGTVYAVCERTLAELATNGWEWFTVNVTLTAGETYYFSLETVGGGEVCPTAVYRPLHLDRIEENVQYFYGGELIMGASAACQYRYRLPLGVTEASVYVTFCLFFAFAAGELICRVIYKARRQV
ncbi:MAG: GPI anchored serine-threonine rich family protein [Clostridium sp.]|nr:GPI anchored serine-threonine rich family protein [Clostridium sp.]